MFLEKVKKTQQRILNNSRAFVTLKRLMLDPFKLQSVQICNFLLPSFFLPSFFLFTPRTKVFNISIRSFLINIQCSKIATYQVLPFKKGQWKEYFTWYPAEIAFTINTKVTKVMGTNCTWYRYRDAARGTPSHNYLPMLAFSTAFHIHNYDEIKLFTSKHNSIHIDGIKLSQEGHSPSNHESIELFFKKNSQRH